MNKIEMKYLVQREWEYCPVLRGNDGNYYAVDLHASSQDDKVGRSVLVFEVRPYVYLVGEEMAGARGFCAVDQYVARQWFQYNFFKEEVWAGKDWKVVTKYVPWLPKTLTEYWALTSKQRQELHNYEF